MKTISRYIMTLALLLTAVTGAWADEPKVYDSGDVEMFSLQAGDILMPGVTLKNSDVNNLAGVNLISNRYSIDGVISQYSNSISSIPFSIGENGLLTAELAGEGPYNCMPITKDGKAGNAWVVTDVFAEPGYKTILICGTTYPAASGPEVAWNAATKTGTFSMPGSDVMLTPIYAKAATFATTGTEPEVKTLLPEAAEGVIAGTDASLIAEGTGIVAFAGTSTEVTQGTLMYAIGTSATEAPALTSSDWKNTVPTAKDVADGGADVHVWYYIQGADAPDGVAATLDNTFSDTEPACLTVQVLSNKFDIQFNAANANTIEAGKATVTVAGTDKTGDVTDGKLQGVKMGSEVKLKANPGYKFRKVEVKKAEAGPLAAAFKDGAKIKVGYQWNFGYTTYLEFTNSGGTYSLTSVSGLNEENGFNSSTLTAKDGNVLALDVVCNPGGMFKMDQFSAQIEFDATSSTYKYSSKGGYFDGIISVSVNDTDVTSQLSEAN